MMREAIGRNAGGYDTGTIAITKDARTVTLTGGTWPAAVVGWHLALGDGLAERYRVVTRTSNSIVVIDRPYEGETETASPYTVWDPYVIAPRDLYKFKSFRYERGAMTLGYEDPAWMDTYWASPKSLGEGIELMTTAEPTTGPRYSTGTVTITKGSASVTLSGGTWPEWAIGRHLRFENETPLYKIAGRTSDSIVTLDRAYGGRFPGAGKSYELDPPGCIRLEIMPPQEDQFALKFRYFCEPQELVNDSDILEGPDTYQNAVVEMATGAYIMSNLPDPTSGGPDAYNKMVGLSQQHTHIGERLLLAIVSDNVPPDQFARMRNIKFM
jgi:hypothetical protein